VGDGRRAREEVRPARSARGLAREVVLIASAMLAYFGIRNITVGSAPRAMENARAVFDIEKSLHLAWESAAQGTVIAHERLVDAANWVYIWGHWPVILTTAVILYLYRRHDYMLMRNAIFVSGALGFLLFGLLPVAPPRLLDMGLVDTVTEQSHAYRALQPPGLTNQFAAFPSLHFGWNVLVGIALYSAFENTAVRAFAVCLPVLMGAAVVVTANHFVIDVIAGGLLVAYGRWFAVLVDRDTESQHFDAKIRDSGS
jgi:membrane-associated phospholipid phosphatase